jgi:hypothetical protein
VRDLGLPELVRAEAVSPDWNYLKSSFKSKHDDRNALPTNSWYQNLLMARGEPSNLQRAYTVPYLVDVVGMLPGVRAHVTHTEANDQVMQLSFDEAFGLVLGATKSLEAKNEDDTSNDHEDEVKEHWKSHKYTVAKATNLGISLEWVSCTIIVLLLMTHTLFLIFLYFSRTGRPQHDLEHCARNAVYHHGIRPRSPTNKGRLKHSTHHCSSDSNGRSHSCGWQ